MTLHMPKKYQEPNEDLSSQSREEDIKLIRAEAYGRRGVLKHLRKRYRHITNNFVIRHPTFRMLQYLKAKEDSRKRLLEPLWYANKIIRYQEGLYEWTPRRRGRRRKNLRTYERIRRYPKREPSAYRLRRAYNRLAETRETKIRFFLQQALIRKGLKAKAVKIADALYTYIKRKKKTINPDSYLEDLFWRYRALVYLRSKRVGSMTYKIPVSLYPLKGKKVLARWLSAKGRERNGKPAIENIIEEFMLFVAKRGSVYKKRVDLHTVAAAGMPYLRYLKKT